MRDDNSAAEGPDEHLGSVAEEAAKLLGALSGWAHEHGDGLGHGFSEFLAGATRSGQGTPGHDTAGDCRFCPVCRLAHLARDTSPEVKEHLAAAAGSLIKAAAGLLSTLVPDEARGGRTADDRVQRIDLDADWPEPPGTD